jgi:hypothetical protein
MGNSQSELESTLKKDYSNVQILKFIDLNEHKEDLKDKLRTHLKIRRVTAGERGYGPNERQDPLPSNCKAEIDFVFNDLLKEELTSLCYFTDSYHVITGDFLYTRGEMLNLKNPREREYFTKNRNFIFRHPVENPDDILESMKSSDPGSTKDKDREKIGISFVKNFYKKKQGGSLLHLHLNSDKTCGLFFNKHNMFENSCHKLKGGKILYLDVGDKDDNYVLVPSQRGDFFCCVKLSIIEEVFKEKGNEIEVLSAGNEFIADNEIAQINNPLRLRSYGRKKSSRNKRNRKGKASNVVSNTRLNRKPKKNTKKKQRKTK